MPDDTGVVKGNKARQGSGEVCLKAIGRPAVPTVLPSSTSVVPAIGVRFIAVLRVGTLALSGVVSGRIVATKVASTGALTIVTDSVGGDVGNVRLRPPLSLLAQM